MECAYYFGRLCHSTCAFVEKPVKSCSGLKPIDLQLVKFHYTKVWLGELLAITPRKTHRIPLPQRYFSARGIVFNPRVIL
jgi:hypothetical protein